MAAQFVGRRLELVRMNRLPLRPGTEPCQTLSESDPWTQAQKLFEKLKICVAVAYVTDSIL
jgi:hypothetical protein